MREVIADIDRWREADRQIALATVVKTWGSAPRREGAKMAMTLDGELSGSVSGGCVEGAVFEAGTQTLKSGQAQLLHFGVADETAWEVGLACGGTIEVFVEPLDDAMYEDLRTAIEKEMPVATATIVRGAASTVGQKSIVYATGEPHAASGGELDERVASAAREALGEGRSQSVSVPSPTGDSEDFEIFVDVLLPPPALVVVGGVHIAIALTAIGKALGYRSVVVDPRKAFGSEARFPDADRLVQAWPKEAFATVSLTPSTAVVMLTHDPKIDDPALHIALRSDAFYVGALGSRSTQARRHKRLLADGLTEEHLARLHGPIGLDLGGRTPEEIALAVMAEIVAARHAPTPATQPASVEEFAGEA